MTCPREIRTLQYIPRWSIIRTLRTQSVAEHSYYVAIYCEWILRSVCCMKWVRTNNIDPAVVLRAALTHDVEESFTSDIPNPIKNRAGLRKNILYKTWESQEARDRFGSLYLEPPEQVKRIVALADIIEACAFLLEERRMGNKEVGEIINHMFKVLEDFCQSEKFQEMTCNNPASYTAVFDLLNRVEHHCDKVTT